MQSRIAPADAVLEPLKAMRRRELSLGIGSIDVAARFASGCCTLPKRGAPLMHAVAIGDWTTFFTAQLGAAATLGGLVFVGLSLNLTKILSFPALPNRALLALGVLLIILVVSSLILIPGQSTELIGFEILVAALLATVVAGSMEVRILRSTLLQNRGKFIGDMIFLGFALVPYAVGGAQMLGGRSVGLYWVAAGVIVSFIKAIGVLATPPAAKVYCQKTKRAALSSGRP
jgi:hypothetical protein